jgi:hypothetical protein
LKSGTDCIIAPLMVEKTTIVINVIQQLVKEASNHQSVNNERKEKVLAIRHLFEKKVVY